MSFVVLGENVRVREVLTRTFISFAVIVVFVVFVNKVIYGHLSSILNLNWGNLLLLICFFYIYKILFVC